MRLLGLPPAAASTDANGVKPANVGTVLVPVLVDDTVVVVTVETVETCVKVVVEKEVVVVLKVSVDSDCVTTAVLVDMTVDVEVTGAGVIVDVGAGRRSVSNGLPLTNSIRLFGTYCLSI